MTRDERRPPPGDAVGDMAAEVGRHLDLGQALVSHLESHLAELTAGDDSDSALALLAEVESCFLAAQGLIASFRGRYGKPESTNPTPMTRPDREQALADAARLLDGRPGQRRVALSVNTKRGPRLATACLEMPGVVRVALRATGEVLAESLPGAPAHLAWPVA